MSETPRTASTDESQDDPPRSGGHMPFVSGSISLLLLVGFLAACLWIDLERGDSPAILEATVRPTPDGGTPSVLVEVKNVGDVTAEDVLVRVEGSGGPKAAPVEETVDFIAPGEAKEFTLPRTGGANADDVDASVVAWTDAG